MAEYTIEEYEAKLSENGTPPAEVAHLVRRERIFQENTQWQEDRHQYPLNAVEAVDARSLARSRAHCTLPPDVVPSPFGELNQKLYGDGCGMGLAHGWHCLLGGTSGRGKTTLALNFAIEAARQGEEVLFIALEGGRDYLHTLLLAIASGLDHRFMGRGHLYDEEQRAKAETELDELPGKIWLTAKPVHEIRHIDTLVRRFADRGVRTFMVDHLQLVKAVNDEEIYRKVTEISRLCRVLSSELGLLSFSPCQLNRPACLNTKQCPTMHDLSGGGTLESDADLVLLLDHCKKHYEYDAMAARIQTRLIVGKNRHGPSFHLTIQIQNSNKRVEAIR